MKQAEIIASLHVQACRSAGQSVAVARIMQNGSQFSYEVYPIRANGHPDVGSASTEQRQRWGEIAEAGKGLGVTWAGMDSPQTFTVDKAAPVAAKVDVADAEKKPRGVKK